MTRHEDERAAAVVVITVITPGETTSVAKAPSAIVRLSEKDVDAIKKARNLDVLQFLKAAVEIEIEICYDTVEVEVPSRPSVVQSGQVSESFQAQMDSLIDPEVDKHTLGDEHTPADHYLRS